MAMNPFDRRIRELEEVIARLRKREREGWRYKKTWVKPTTVKKHRRAGYYAMLPVKKR